MNNISLAREELDEIKVDEDNLKGIIKLGLQNYTNPFSSFMAIVRLIAVSAAYIALFAMRKRKTELRLDLWEHNQSTTHQDGVDGI